MHRRSSNSSSGRSERPMASPAPGSWWAAVSNEARTALVTELYNELMRREQDWEAASTRVRVWVAAANAELTLWRTSPDKESYVAGVRLKVAQWGAELDAYGAQHYSTAQPVSPIENSLPPRDRVPAPAIVQRGVLGHSSSPPLTLQEQTHVARYLVLLDAQNLEIVELYQRHFNEIQRLVTSHVVNRTPPKQCKFQKQELQREQEGARLQLQQLHELQQRKLLAHPTNSLNTDLVRSPSVDAHGCALREGHAPLVATARVAAPDDTDTSSLDEVVLSPLSITADGRAGDALHPGTGAGNHATSWHKLPAHADGTDFETLATMTFLPYTPPTANGGLGNLELPPGHPATGTAASYSGKESMVSPGDHAGMSWTANVGGSATNQVDSADPPPPVLLPPVVTDLTSTANDDGSRSSAGERRTTANEALRLYYTARVGELHLTYKTDLVALYRELRQMREGEDEDANARKIDGLMVDIRKILVVLTRSTCDELAVDERVEELDRVEVYIQRRVHPMSQRLKVKQAIFGDQSRVPVSAARTAQRQWQRFLRRMRDQQQQSPTALPVNVSPPRRLEM